MLREGLHQLRTEASSVFTELTELEDVVIGFLLLRSMTFNIPPTLVGLLRKRNAKDLPRILKKISVRKSHSKV